jgi:nucleotide-binding universal stress UspA family protein
MFKRILVARDGSENAKRALAEAIDVARSQDASLTLLTVATLQPVWPGLVPPISETDLLNGAKEILASGAALVPEGIRVSERTTTGHPGTEILRRAAAADHDLIVIGSRGRGAVRSAVLGSVSHFVLNHGTVPMLIVHDNGDWSPPADRTRSARGEEVGRR